jgi:hypothetical protein
MQTASKGSKGISDVVSSGDGGVRAKVAVGVLPGWGAIATTVCENSVVQ